jgi:cytochrome c553
MMRRLALFLGFLAMLALGGLLRRWVPGAREDAERQPIAGALERFLPAGLTPRRLVHAGLLLATAAGVLGVIVLVSGVVPIKASSGHWQVTRWFLDFAMSRSFSTYSFGVEAPPLDDPALVLRGAGHYEGACRPCHGSVTGVLPAIPRAMTPNPPLLPGKIAAWEPRELFSIVKHGVKFTGMPAWPARQRDDEVWAVVAFLRRMPQLDPAEYRQLSGADFSASSPPPIADLAEVSARPPSTVLQTCGRCHGLDGLGRGFGAFPKLAGQRVAYLENALRAYATGRRHSGIMQPIAEGLSDEVRRELAVYYARLPSDADAREPQELRQLLPAPRWQLSAARREQGARLAAGAVDGVPACLQCHGDGPVNRAYPILAGQYAGYLDQQLRLFKDGRRGGSEYAHIMRKVVQRLTPEQAAAAAEFFAARPRQGRLAR